MSNIAGAVVTGVVEIEFGTTTSLVESRVCDNCEGCAGTAPNATVVPHAVQVTRLRTCSCDLLIELS